MSKHYSKKTKDLHFLKQASEKGRKKTNIGLKSSLLSLYRCVDAGAFVHVLYKI